MGWKENQKIHSLIPWVMKTTLTVVEIQTIEAKILEEDVVVEEEEEVIGLILKKMLRHSVWTQQKTSNSIMNKKQQEVAEEEEEKEVVEPKEMIEKEKEIITKMLFTHSR